MLIILNKLGGENLNKCLNNYVTFLTFYKINLNQSSKNTQPPALPGGGFLQ